MGKPLPSLESLPPQKVDTNARITRVAPGKTEVRFPKDGYLRSGCHEFRDHDELLRYVYAVFELRLVDGSIQGSMTRRGRYRRVDANGRSIFTFGDPVLDLITDEHGCVTVGRETFDMAKVVTRDGRAPQGVLSVKSPLTRENVHAEAVRAAMGSSSFMLTEFDGSSVTLVSKNPKSLIIKSEPNVGIAAIGAWRTNGWVYWSLGAYLEVKNGKNFKSAKVKGAYANFCTDKTPHCCVIKVDEDTAKNDNYVDELEWGVFGGCPDGVRSRVSASWGTGINEVVGKDVGCNSWNGTSP